jgi:hypothetical protein
MVGPYRLVTLLEILEIQAEAFWRLSSVVGQLFVRLETGFPPVEQIAPTLGELRRESERLGIRVAVSQLDRINEVVQGDGWNSLQALAELLRPLVRDLHLRVIDELGDRFFLSLPSENVAYYRQSEPLFGAEVEARLPQLSEDIAEAGKCLAVGRSTAAVFHLMRVMEIAVQKFGDKLGVPLAHEKYWQVILDGINKAIRAMDQRAAQTKMYAAASAHLYNVKLAWRNEVMHPKQTYTDQEARKVFLSVDTFIRDLVGML